jgi:ribonuclease P protein component
MAQNRIIGCDRFCIVLSRMESYVLLPIGNFVNPNMSISKDHPSQSLRPAERLKSPELVSQVYNSGSRKVAFPLVLIAAPGTGKTHRVAISVPKRKIRKAVDRNLQKRRMREAYRKHKHLLPEGRNLDMILLFQGHQLADYATVVKSLERLLDHLKS